MTTAAPQDLADQLMIDVVIPVRSGLQFLPQAIESVALQNRPHRLTIVDDGAGSRLRDIVARAVDELAVQRRLQVEVIANAGEPGIGGARNTGAAAGTAPLLTFLDADDLWPRDRSRALADLLASTSRPAMAFGMAEQFADPGGEAVGGRIPATAAGGVLIARATWELVGGFDEDLRLGEFIDWVARARRAGVIELTTDSLVLRRRIHRDNTTRQRLDERAAYAAVVRRHLRRGDG